MRVISLGSRTPEVAPRLLQPAAPSSSDESSPAAASMASAVLGPAAEALQSAPEIDFAKVEALRDALARGELKFNAQRLASLIERFHKGHE